MSRPRANPPRPATHGDGVTTYPVVRDGAVAWVVSDAGGWLPGSYESQQAAALAAVVLSAEQLAELNRINFPDGEGGEDRLITLVDVERAMEGATL